MDTLQLQSDDDMFVFGAVQSDFGVKLPVRHPYNTVGDLFDATIGALEQSVSGRTEACFSMLTFHRLRTGVRAVRPDLTKVDLDFVLASALTFVEQRALRDHVAATYHLTIDAFVLTRLSFAVAMFVFFGSLTMFLALFWENLNGWLFAGGMLLAAVSSLVSTFVLPRRLDPGSATVRALVLRMRTSNMGRLIRELGMPREPELWQAFSDSIARSLGRNLDGLHRGTRFA